MFGRKTDTNKLVRCECGAMVRERSMATHWLMEHLNKERQAVRVTSVLDERKA